MSEPEILAGCPDLGSRRCEAMCFAAEAVRERELSLVAGPSVSEYLARHGRHKPPPAGFGVIAPSDVELLEGRGISQLRSLSSVFRDAAAELGL